MKSSQEGCNYQVDSNGVMQQEISGAQDLQREKITIDCYLFKALQTNREPYVTLSFPEKKLNF